MLKSGQTISNSKGMSFMITIDLDIKIDNSHKRLMHSQSFKNSLNYSNSNPKVQNTISHTILPQNHGKDEIDRFKEKLTKTISMKELENQINKKPISSRNNHYIYLNDMENTDQLVPETGGDVIPKADRMYSSHQRNKTLNFLSGSVNDYTNNHYMYSSKDNQFSSSDNLGIFTMPIYNESFDNRAKFNKMRMFTK